MHKIPILISRDMGGVLHTDFTHIEALNIKTSNTLTTSSAGGGLGNHHANMVMEIITMSKKDNIKVLGIMEGGYEMPNRVYDDTGISPSIRTFQGGGLEPKVIQIRQATKEGTIPCLIGGGSGSKLSNEQNKERKSDRYGNDKSDTNNGGCP